MEWSGKKVLMMPWRRDAEHEAETLAEYPTADIELDPDTIITDLRDKKLID